MIYGKISYLPKELMFKNYKDWLKQFGSLVD